jgi:hypothetical protein
LFQINQILKDKIGGGTQLKKIKNLS